MKAARWVLPVLAAIGLAGCFTSKTPLITDADAVAPYEKISFATATQPDDWKVLVRDGKTYTAKTDNGEPFELRLRPFGDDLYLAQASSETKGQRYTLYAFVQLAPDRKTAVAYRAIAEVEKDTGPGLAPCKLDDTTVICVENVDAYLKLAKAAVEAGRKDMAYNIKLE
jgi:hypothetical protein